MLEGYRKEDLLTTKPSRHDMSDSLEEKEAGQQRYLRKHNRISGYNIKKGDDIQDADRIENDISRSSQGSLQKGEHGGSSRDTTVSEGRSVL